MSAQPWSVVLGAGLMGRLLAHALTQEGHRVEVFEAQQADAQGAAARVAAAMSPLQGGEGRRAGALPWRACTGSVGGGHVATLAIAPWPLGTRCDWYISPWGVMTANPCLNEPLFMEPGAAALTLGARLLVCDGRPTDEDIQQALSEPASDG